MKTTIGILGGMGPMATVDFAHKIIKLTPAHCDQEHLPLLIHSVPQIPDRTACLMHNAESPFLPLKEGINALIDGGAGCIAIPCNTAHYWYEMLAKECNVPILHITDACLFQLQKKGIDKVAIMATDGTLKAGFYPRKLSESGIEVTLPSANLQTQIMQGIYDVKQGNLDSGAERLTSAFQALLNQGAKHVILGCTEIPLALDHTKAQHREQSIDATAALAQYCIDWYQQHTSMQHKNIA